MLSNAFSGSLRLYSIFTLKLTLNLLLQDNKQYFIIILAIICVSVLPCFSAAILQLFVKILSGNDCLKSGAIEDIAVGCIVALNGCYSQVVDFIRRPK